jgi:hypothetical protein
VTRRKARAAISVLVALLLPFPGPHIDGWLPMGAVIAGGGAATAPPPFFAIAAVVVIAYAGLVFAALSALRYLSGSRRTAARTATK